MDHLDGLLPDTRPREGRGRETTGLGRRRRYAGCHHLRPAPKTAHYKLTRPLPSKHRLPAVCCTDPRMPGRYRSKTLATWLALLLGSLGVHRLYLYGWSDRLAWLQPLPTLAGLAGVVRMQNLGQDDRVAWLLVPLFGLALSVAMLTGIVYGLTPDEKWDGRHNLGLEPQPTAWGPVLGAIFGLMVGGALLMGSIAYGGQKFFEWQLGG
jgi:hypothetical protein